MRIFISIFRLSQVQYGTFDTLSVDEQADALVALGRNQSTQGYRFVWAVAQGHCTPHCDHKPCPEPCGSCPSPYNGTHGSSMRLKGYFGQQIFNEPYSGCEQLQRRRQFVERKTRWIS